MPAKPHINPVVLRQVVAELKARGEYSASLFRGLGFTDETLDKDPDFLVSYRQISTVVQRALRHATPESLGLRVGRRRTAVSTGLAGLGLMTCGSVHEACFFLTRHTWAFGTPLQIEVAFEPRLGLTITASPGFENNGIEDFLVEEFFCAVVCLLRGLVGPVLKVSRVELTLSRLPHLQELREFLGGDVLYNQHSNRLFIGAELASAVPASADAVVMNRVALMLRQPAVQPRPSDVVATIEQILREQIATPPTLIQLADMLHTSERTLRRKLGDQQTNYQGLLDKVRKEQALSLLQGEGVSLSAVTAALGFSDVRNLRRAVKRWTGQAPATLRKEAGA